MIGGGDNSADLEVLLLAAEILNRIGLGEKFVLTINDVGSSMVCSRVEPDDAARESLRRLVDTRDIAQLQRFL